MHFLTGLPKKGERILGRLPYGDKGLDGSFGSLWNLILSNIQK